MGGAGRGALGWTGGGNGAAREGEHLLALVLGVVGDDLQLVEVRPHRILRIEMILFAARKVAEDGRVQGMVGRAGWCLALLR